MKSDKAKKQAVISAAYSHQACESRRKDAQRAGVLWSDEDYEYCKLDCYCSGSIIEKLVTKEVRVFHAYLEDWEDVLFNSKGDDIHAAQISAKYGVSSSWMRTRMIKWESSESLIVLFLPNAGRDAERLKEREQRRRVLSKLISIRFWVSMRGFSLN
jgi:hypothetical protein